MASKDILETISVNIDKKLQNEISGNAKDNEKRYEYEDVLNLIGFGTTQWIVLFTCGLLLMMVINETMGMSILTIASQCDFETNSVQKAILSAACFIGILLSSYFWGYMSDTVGRRIILIYASLTGNAFSAVSMFIPNFWAFVAVRFLVGIFIAGASSTTYAYLGEFFTARHRPAVINYASMFVGISMAYVPAAAWLILSVDWTLHITDDFDFRPWRILILFNLLPGFIASLVLTQLPESPKMLLALNKEDEALNAIDLICRRNTKRPLSDLKVFHLKAEAQPIEENVLITSKSVLAALKKMWKETKPLFQRPHVLNFIICCVVMCGVFLSSTGMGLWYPEIQNRVGATDEQLTVCKVIDASIEKKAKIGNETLCDDTINTKSYVDSITYGLTYVVGYIVLGMIINPLGRKAVMIGSLCLSGLCGIALNWLVQPIGIVVVFCLFLLLPGLCISILNGAVVDLVPTHLRGKAVCICLMLGRSGSVIGSNIIGALLESYCDLTFGLFTGCVLLCAALTMFLPI